MKNRTTLITNLSYSIVDRYLLLAINYSSRCKIANEIKYKVSYPAGILHA